MIAREILGQLRRRSIQNQGVPALDVFSHLSSLTYLKLRCWAKRRHPTLDVLSLVATWEGANDGKLQQRGATLQWALEEELGVPPSAETTTLYQQIRSQSAGVETAAVPRITPPTRVPAFLTEEEVPAIDRSVFVAREQELARLEGFLTDALSGQGKVVLITGDVGSGKTALIQALGHRAQDVSDELVAAFGNCHAQTGPGDPYGSFREMLGLLMGDVESAWAGGSISRENGRRLWALLPVAAQAVTEFGQDLFDTLVPGAALVSRALTAAPEGSTWLDRLQRLSERGRRRDISLGATQQQLFVQMTNVLEALGKERPLLLVIDDAQWADVASINLLFHLGRRLSGNRVLFVVAYRPQGVALGRDGVRHPLESVINELKRTFGQVQVDLDKAAGRGFVEAYLDA
jgi:hypothetical protein